jgi:aryl-alcohol dehydrogenase-like predicted oxidoreductase
MSGMYGPADRAQSIATLHAALDGGITLLDTGDFYGRVGPLCGPFGGRCGHPTRARAVHPICDLQIEYSLVSRGIEAEILPACRELDIGITAYRVLSRGLISGHWWRERSSGEKRFCGMSPRFQGENLEKNLALVEQLRAVAQEIGASVAQVAIAWVAAQGDDIVPLIGARRRTQSAESLGALDVKLTSDQLGRLSKAVPLEAVAGERYPAARPRQRVRGRRVRFGSARRFGSRARPVRFPAACSSRTGRTARLARAAADPRVRGTVRPRALR